jgi:hypothetical protein
MCRSAEKMRFFVLVRNEILTYWKSMFSYIYFLLHSTLIPVRIRLLAWPQLYVLGNEISTKIPIKQKIRRLYYLFNIISYFCMRSLQITRKEYALLKSHTFLTQLTINSDPTVFYYFIQCILIQETKWSSKSIECCQIPFFIPIIWQRDSTNLHNPRLTSCANKCVNVCEFRFGEMDYKRTHKRHMKCFFVGQKLYLSDSGIQASGNCT